MNVEEWREILGFPEYAVSSIGRVRKSGGQLVRVYDSQGYQNVGLGRVPARKIVGIHRLVAQAFIPNPLGKPEVNHLDGDKRNNAVQNLEWSTHAENMRHATLAGLMRNCGPNGLARQGNERRRKIPADSMVSPRELEVWRHLALGMKCSEIANMNQKSIKTVDHQRDSLMKKLKARGVADLTRMAIRYGVIDEIKAEAAA